MKTINWQRILDQNGVEYIERGSNVKRGNVNIHCPFCGNADPSHHMGINLANGWWGCWRNQNHRGKSPVRLLVRLLGISYHRACEIAGVTDDYVDPDGFDALAARLMGREQLTKVEEVEHRFLSMPKEFVTIVDSGSTRRAWEYLISRGFPDHDLSLLIQQYHLKFSRVGDFKDRIILPFFMNGVLVSWTGRAIADSFLRYRDLSLDECLLPIKEILFNHDCMLSGGRILILVEGPMDALKLDYYGRGVGVRAVALATNSISEDQIFTLEEGSPYFKKVLVMMDNAGPLGVVDSMRMKERLSQIRNLGFIAVPEGYKDAGDLPPAIVRQFCRRLNNEQL